MNRDGKLDLIAADEFGFIVVFIGNGDGTFIETLRVQTGQQTNGVTVGDFNRDGKLDLAVANFGSDTISILLGNGDGTFQPKTDYLAGHFPGFVTTSDFNRDGALDLVVANSTSISNSGLPGSVSIFLGNGDGTFRPKVDYLSGADAVVLGAFRNSEQRYRFAELDLLTTTPTNRYNAPIIRAIEKLAPSAAPSWLMTTTG